MKTINPFVPSISTSLTVPSQIAKTGGTLYLANRSNYDCQIDFQNGHTAMLLAQFARPYKLWFPLNGFVVSFQSQIVAPPLSNPYIWGEAFQPGEDTTGLFTGPLTSDITALGTPQLLGFQNLDNITEKILIPTGQRFYLTGFDLTMDKAATPVSGLMSISGLDGAILGTNTAYYWLIQSASQVWIEKKFDEPLPSVVGIASPQQFLQFAFPNLSASIGFNIYGWYQ